jgi:vacuolar-type H+-ATPase subunit D/Vma8
MTKKLNPMLKAENRQKLLLSGMENIDMLQQQTIADAQKIIKDYQQFKERIERQFEENIKAYKAGISAFGKIDEASAQSLEVWMRLPRK